MADGGSEFENSPRRVKNLLPLAIFSHDRRGGQARVPASRAHTHYFRKSHLCSPPLHAKG